MGLKERNDVNIFMIRDLIYYIYCIYLVSTVYDILKIVRVGNFVQTYS